MAWKTSQKSFIYKLYQPQSGATSSEIFLRTLTDVESEFETEFSLYGGLGPLTLRFSKKIDELPSDLTFNNRVKVYVKDKWNQTPKLIYYGYIVSLDPVFREGEEGTGVTLLGAVSKLQNDFLRTGDDLAFEVSPGTIGSHIQSIINNYRSYVPNSSMISNDYSLMEDTTAVGSIPYRFFNLKHLEAIREITKFLPKDDSANNFWIWYLNPEGKFVLRKLSTTTDHTLLLKKNIIEVSLRKNIEGMVNKVFFWNEQGAASPTYVHKVYDDVSSQSSHDIIAEEITDSAISTTAQADLLGQGKLKELKDIQAEATVRVDASTYDIFSFKPGDLVKIRDIKTSTLFPDRMIITRIRWRENEAELELSTPRPDITTQVEKERRYIEEQLRWFGKILTNIDGTRISSGVQHWTATGITFTPVSGADAYRKIEWTAGTFWLPNGVKRVITNGDTGLMTSNLYVYLDEKNKWSAKDKGETTPSESGTGSITKGGDTLLDSTKNWTTDQWKGYILILNPGASQEKHIIRGNGATTLYVETDDKFDLASGSYSYEIWKFALRTTTDISTLSFEDQIVIYLAKPNADTTAKAEGIPQISAVMDSFVGEPDKVLTKVPAETVGAKGWSHNLTFSATDYNTVSWSTGTLALSDGTSYSITAGNTGDMTATTYIFWDKSSPNILQTTTTATDSVGGTRILVAVAKNVSDTTKKAQFQVFGGAGGVGGTFITASEIAANTITGNEIAANTISANNISFNYAGSTSKGGSAIDTDAVSGYSASIVGPGGSRAYSGLDASGYVKLQLDSTKMTAGTPPSTGIYIDSTGIYGRYNGVNKFRISTADGSAYFAGEIGASTLTGNLQTAASGQRVTLESGVSGLIRFYSSTYETAILFGSGTDLMISTSQSSGKLFLNVGASGAIVFAQAGTIKSYIDAVGDIHIGAGNATLNNSSNTAELRLNKDFVPSSDNVYTLGSSGLRWKDFRAMTATFSGLSVSPYGCLRLPSGGYEGRIYSGSNWCVINARTYGTHYAVGFDNLGDTLPEGSGIWDLGGSFNKWNLYYGGTTACDLPTYNSALKVFKKIKNPVVKSGHFGTRQYFDEDEFPSEFKYKDKRSGKEVIEGFHTLGACVQAIRELIQKVENLDEKYVEISKKVNP